MKYKRQIIGKHIKIIESNNKDLEGIEGTILDESMNTIIVSSDDTRKKVLKKGSRFEIDGDIVDGENLASRPEDRIKD